MKRKYAIHKGRTVRIMAEAEGYAMARLRGAMPFIVAVKKLKPAGELKHE